MVLVKLPADESGKMKNLLDHGMDLTALLKLMGQMSVQIKCTIHRRKESKFTSLESNIGQLISSQLTGKSKGP